MTERSPVERDVNVLLCAAGRRPYLVEWFAQSYEKLGYTGRLVVADSDPLAPAQVSADIFEIAPPVSHPDYREWLEGTLQRHRIDLALSVNDFELSAWSRFGEDDALGALVRLDHRTQDIVEDKVLTAEHLHAAGALVPPTESAADASIRRPTGQQLVVKGRFGSGSKGLRLVDADHLEHAVSQARSEVTDREGRPGEDRVDVDELIVVQPRIVGVEYGLDVIADLNGTHRSVLVRRKLSMRSGETDKATTVDAERFGALAEVVSAAIPHRGSIDVDVIEDEDGRLWVIDINPRFGGGYPFSHVAGADVPSAYVAWAAGDEAIEEWLTSRSGVSAAKTVGVTVIGARAQR